MSAPKKVDLYTQDELDPLDPALEPSAAMATEAKGQVGLQGPGLVGFWTPNRALKAEDDHGIALVSWASFVATHWGAPIELTHERGRARELTELQERAILLRRLYHIPNGMRTYASVAKRFKAMGLRAHVPDYHLPATRLRGAYAGLYIELKTPGRYVGADQRLELELLRAEGYAALGARGWWRAAAILRQYLDLPPETTAWQ